MSRGGVRHGAGRKQQAVIRKPRSFYATDDEWLKIKIKAENRGITVSEYLRVVALQTDECYEKESMMPANEIAIKMWLDTLKDSRHPHWLEIGNILNVIKNTGYWKSTHGSFTEWVQDNLNIFCLKRGSIWRIISSYRFVCYMIKWCSERNITFGINTIINNDISAESIEILSKIKKVKDDEHFQLILIDLINNKYSRDTLRDLWNKYKKESDTHQRQERYHYKDLIDTITLNDELLLKGKL